MIEAFKQGGDFHSRTAIVNISYLMLIIVIRVCIHILRRRYSKENFSWSGIQNKEKNLPLYLKINMDQKGRRRKL